MLPRVSAARNDGTKPFLSGELRTECFHSKMVARSCSVSDCGQVLHDTLLGGTTASFIREVTRGCHTSLINFGRIWLRPLVFQPEINNALLMTLQSPQEKDG